MTRGDVARTARALASRRAVERTAQAGSVGARVREPAHAILARNAAGVGAGLALALELAAIKRRALRAIRAGNEVLAGTAGGGVSFEKSQAKKKKKNGMERARRALAGRVVAAVRPAHTRDAQHGAPGAGDRAGNGVENGTRRNVRAEASRDAIQRNGPSQGPNRCPGGAPRASRKVRGAKCAWERERDRARART